MSPRDLAVIFLDQPLLDVTLGFQLTETDLQIRHTLTVVGYGLDKPRKGSVGRRFFGRNEVTGMALSNLIDKDDQDVVFLFERPGAHAAPGDSGGPCFRESGQGRWLVGIVSQPRADGRGSRFTSLYPHLLWLKEQLEKAEQLRKSMSL